MFRGVKEKRKRKLVGLGRFVIVLLFIPLGFFSARWFEGNKKRKVILTGFIVTTVIELCQLIFRLGFFEIDDFIYNMIGNVIGLSIGVFYNTMISYKKNAILK